MKYSIGGNIPFKAWRLKSPFEEKGKLQTRIRETVNLITTDGIAEPHGEIKEVAYFKDSNVPVSFTTKKIIEQFLAFKKAKPEGAKSDN